MTRAQCIGCRASVRAFTDTMSYEEWSSPKWLTPDGRHVVAHDESCPFIEGSVSVTESDLLRVLADLIDSATEMNH